MKLKKTISLLILILVESIVFGGFFPDTLVKVPDGYLPIEQLESGDTVISLDSKGSCFEKIISNTRSFKEKKCFCIVIDQEEIIASQNQKFFIADQNIWKSAKDLKRGDILFDGFGFYGEIQKISEFEESELFEIEVEDFHKFFVSEKELLAHNFAATAAAGIGLAKIVASLVAGAAAVAGISNTKSSDLPPSMTFSSLDVPSKEKVQEYVPTDCVIKRPKRYTKKIVPKKHATINVPVDKSVSVPVSQSFPKKATCSVSRPFDFSISNSASRSFSSGSGFKFSASSNGHNSINLGHVLSTTMAIVVVFPLVFKAVKGLYGWLSGKSGWRDYNAKQYSRFAYPTDLKYVQSRNDYGISQLYNVFVAERDRLFKRTCEGYKSWDSSLSSGGYSQPDFYEDILHKAWLNTEFCKFEIDAQELLVKKFDQEENKRAAARVAEENRRLENLRQQEIAKAKRKKEAAEKIQLEREKVIQERSKKEITKLIDSEQFSTFKEEYKNAMLRIANNEKTYEVKYFEFNDELKSFMQAYGFDVEIYEHCAGNVLQQIIHEEFISTLDQMSYIEIEHFGPDQKTAFEELQKLTVELSKCGCINNREGNISTALDFSNVCQNLFDCSSLIVPIADESLLNSPSITHFNREIIKKLEKQKQKIVQKKVEEVKQKISSDQEPDEPDDEDDEDKDDEEKQDIPIFEKNAKHIFRNKKNHFPEDTPANRKRLLDLVSDAEYHLGKCLRNGKDWYGKIVEHGKQLWAEVVNGTIRNGGLNEVPIEFDPVTGLSKRFKL